VYLTDTLRCALRAEDFLVRLRIVTVVGGKRALRALGCLASVALLAAGCVDTRVVTADQVRSGKGEELTLYLRDGRRIQLPAGQYRVLHDTVESIKGTGRVLGTTPNDLGSRWEGAVRFAEIDSVRTQKDSGLSRATGISITTLTIVAGGFLLLLGLSFSHMH
jgi:hypothetical protein